MNIDKDLDLIRKRLTEKHINIFGGRFLILYEKEIQAIENILNNVKIEKNKRVRAVKQFDENNNLLETYSSIAEASRMTRITAPAICKACKGQQKMASGYIWRYENE